MTTYPEERVLKPLNPLPDDVNEWPDFALREVKIFYQGKGRYADLFEAAEDVPLCVLGELMPLEDDQEHLALIDDPTYVRMKVDNVTNYSYGLTDNNKAVIWVAGKAGWYEITPSDRYLTHYNDTVEAIDMFYFMVEQHQKLGPKRNRKGFLIDPFLREYQKHTDYRVDDDDEAMEILHKHHKFLLKQMLEERENIDWSQTHLWNHLAQTYGAEIDVLRSKLVQHAEVDMEVEASSSATDEDDEEGNEVSEELASDHDNDDHDSQNSQGSQQSAPANSTRSHDGSHSSSDTEDDQTDWTRPIWALLNVLRKTPTYEIKTAGIDTLATEVEKMPGFTGSHKAATKAIERATEPLLRLMNEAKLRKKFNWSTRAIYAELEATLAEEVAENTRTPAPRASKKKHRLKSVLRPSGASKASKRTSSMHTRADDEDDEDENMHDLAPAPAHPLAGAMKQHMINGRRGASVESVASRMDSPSRQLNGHFDVNALPELPPEPQVQEALDLIRSEAKKHGRINQVYNLEALLGRFNGELG